MADPLPTVYSEVTFERHLPFQLSADLKNGHCDHYGELGRLFMKLKGDAELGLQVMFILHPGINSFDEPESGYFIPV